MCHLPGACGGEPEGGAGPALRPRLPPGEQAIIVIIIIIIIITPSPRHRHQHHPYHLSIGMVVVIIDTVWASEPLPAALLPSGVPVCLDMPLPGQGLRAQLPLLPPALLRDHVNGRTAVGGGGGRGEREDAGGEGWAGILVGRQWCWRWC